MTQGIDIRYLGFHPSEWTQAYLDDAISALQERLPFGSRIRAVIKRQDKMLVAQIDILSKWGRCFVPARAARITQLCSLVEQKVQRQTNRWRDRHRRNRSA